MQTFPMIVAMAIATYATRIAGFTVTRLTVPRAAGVFLKYVPIAAFAALIASGMQAESGGLGSRVIGVVIAGAVILRWGRLWAALVAGMGFYWLSEMLV